MDVVQMLIVDNRWRGEHGIGRFATEVIDRLKLPWRPLAGGASPTSPVDILNKFRLRLVRNAVVFTPGFNAGITRAKQLLVVHDLIHLSVTAERSVSKSLYYNLIVRSAIRRAGVVMTVSQTSANALSQWLNSPSVKIEIVGNGCSRSFTEAGSSTEYARPTFMYVGNLKPHKNVDVLFDAIALRPDFDLILVTSDADHASSEMLRRGLESQVKVVSGVSDNVLAAMYRGSAGVLQPSLLEGFGLPVLEAMSCGTRVAYWTGCESVREICAEHGQAVESSSSPEQWAAAMDELQLAAASGPLEVSEAWRNQYDWDTVAANVQRVVDEELGTLVH